MVLMLWRLLDDGEPIVVINLRVLHRLRPVTRSPSEAPDHMSNTTTPLRSEEIGSVPENPADFEHYFDLADGICRRFREDSRLSDDEIIVLAVVASQLALARYVEPGGDSGADELLNTILDILDRGQVVQAVANKMLWLLNHRPRPRADAPTGRELTDLTNFSDREKPTKL